MKYRDFRYLWLRICKAHHLFQWDFARHTIMVDRWFDWLEAKGKSRGATDRLVDVLIHEEDFLRLESRKRDSLLPDSARSPTADQP